VNSRHKEASGGGAQQAEQFPTACHGKHTMTDSHKPTSTSQPVTLSHHSGSSSGSQKSSHFLAPSSCMVSSRSVMRSARSTAWSASNLQEGRGEWGWASCGEAVS
jgi:hypothetical protein